MIKELPTQEKPRERCLKHGASTLSLRECLAVLLGTGPRGKGCLGLAEDLLFRLGVQNEDDRSFDRFARALELQTLQLEDLKGMGPAGKSRLLVALEICKRYRTYLLACQSAKSPLESLEEVAIQTLKKVPLSERQASYEWFAMICVFNRDEIGSFQILEKGSRTHVNVDLIRLFALLLSLAPKGFVLCHNHPSGDVTVSDSDRHLTQRIFDLSKNFNIHLLGHWVVTPDRQRWIPTK